jgi:hypothetical protein
MAVSRRLQFLAILASPEGYCILVSLGTSDPNTCERYQDVSFIT